MSRYKQKIRENIKLLFYFYFFRDFRPIVPIIWIYLSAKLGSYAIAMSYLSMIMIFSALFEVPTGIFSDKIGRKRTLMLAALLSCGESIIYIIAHNIQNNVYYLYILAALFRGFTISMYSGTDQALSYESLASLKKSHKFHVFGGKLISMVAFSYGIACLVGGILGEISFLWVFYINLFAQIITLSISQFLVEPNNVKRSEERSLKHFIISFKYMIRNKRLKNLSIGTIIENGFGNVSMEFRQVFLKTIVPIWLIGFTRFLRYILGGISFWFSGKVIDKFGYFKVIISVTILSKIIAIFAVLLASILTPFIFILNTSIRAPYHTAMEALMQKEYKHKQRATMGSIVSFFKTIF
ncbi:MFS transporter, partial [Pseudomonadota bacterium]